MTPAEPGTVSLADDGPPNHDDREDVASEAGGSEEIRCEEIRCKEIRCKETRREEGSCEAGARGNVAGTALV